MKHFLIHNWYLKLFSLALAAMLWLTIASETSSEIGLNVPLQFRNMPPAYEIVEENVNTVELRLRGASNLVKQISAEGIAAVISLSGVTPGEKILPLTTKNINVPFGIEVVRVNPTRVRLVLERTISKLVPVRPALRGQVAEGFEVAGMEVNPSMIEVQGPESRIRSITAIGTATIPIEGHSQPFQQYVDLEVTDPLVRLQYLSLVEVRIDVRDQYDERKLVVAKDASLDHWNVRPTKVEITVKGPKRSVQAVNPEDIHFTVESEGLSRGRHELTPKVIGLGDGIEVLSTKPETVRVVVR